MKIHRILLGMIVLIMSCLPLTAFAAEAPMITVDMLLSPGEEGALRFTIDNPDSSEHNYTFFIKDLVDGFSAYFMVEGVAVNNMDVAALNSAVAQVNIEAPANPVQKVYDFTVISTRDDGETTSFPVHVSMNLDYSVSLISEVDRMESMIGKPFDLQVVVSNTGNKTLENVSITADLPYKWFIERVVPETLTLTPGESGLFQLKVMIPAAQNSGNTQISISAGNEKTQSQTITIPVKVTGKANFALVLIGAVVITGIATYIYFRKNGRR